MKLRHYIEQNQQETVGKETKVKVLPQVRSVSIPETLGVKWEYTPCGMLLRHSAVDDVIAFLTF